MLFYEPLFLFFVLPVFYSIFFMLSRYPLARKNLIALFSILFYGWIEPRIVLIVLLITLTDYFCGCMIVAEGEPSPRRTSALVIGIIINLAVLFYYKYFNFVILNLSALIVQAGFSPLPETSVLLPVGISF